MYSNSAYWHHTRQDFKDKKHPLFVSSVGTYHLHTIPCLPTYRPRGRLDYQLIYISSGKAYFYFNGKEEVVTAGNMVLYRPKEEQRYYYYGTDQTEVYWVHFTGNDVKNILRKYGISDDMRVIFTGISMDYKNIFLQMLRELQLCNPDYEELLTHYFMELLIILHRLILDEPKKKKISHMPEMEDAVQYFQSNYNKAISIKHYALSHNMSEGWFIQNFKEYTNTSPARYVLSLRMANAQILLESTNYNISEIANIVGYDNPFYFSRIFKKQFGISPSEYRSQMLNLSSTEAES